MKKYKILLALTILVLPFFVSAHQPKISKGLETNVSSPEISKAYYAQLSGQNHIYNISSERPFHLYVNLLVPDVVGQKTDISAIIINNGNADNYLVAMLDGNNFQWKKFFEPFGRDTYLQGPEFKADVPAGTYNVIVTSNNKDSKYAIAIGETESFGFSEGINAITLIPQIKKNFFNESPINFVLSPFGWGFILVMFALAFVFGFIFQYLIKRFHLRIKKRGRPKNLHTKDRIVRVLLGVFFLLLAITTSWNPALLFFAGFCFFEAIFSWCIFYATIGKTTCPV